MKYGDVGELLHFLKIKLGALACIPSGINKELTEAGCDISDSASGFWWLMQQLINDIEEFENTHELTSIPIEEEVKNECAE
jgi:hypothetical protein